LFIDSSSIKNRATNSINSIQSRRVIVLTTDMTIDPSNSGAFSLERMAVRRGVSPDSLLPGSRPLPFPLSLLFQLRHARCVFSSCNPLLVRMSFARSRWHVRLLALDSERKGRCLSNFVFFKFTIYKTDAQIDAQYTSDEICAERLLTAIQVKCGIRKIKYRRLLSTFVSSSSHDFRTASRSIPTTTRRRSRTTTLVTRNGNARAQSSNRLPFCFFDLNLFVGFMNILFRARCSIVD
jgi:hypothetical protein